MLGLHPEASQEEVRAAWRRIALTTHPDHGGDRQAFELARDAYRRLRCREADNTVVLVHRLDTRRLVQRWLRRRLRRSPARVI